MIHLLSAWRSSLLVASLLLGYTAQAQTPRPGAVKYLNPTTVHPPKGYSQAASLDLGPVTMLIMSGQVALDTQGRVVGAGDVGQQADQAFRNIQRIVEAAGGTMQHVVKLNYFLLDASQLPAVRTARDRYVNTATPPASTAVQVSKLFREELLIEIEATAIIPKK
ncbi:RidA family protein [Hymenobacter sp. 15J16-1T3B]|uniref:RidA family protein n=1 Tax=Hymenobacter sp. 15J16-1T3B TaxID=2886941 RepID=UPI001D12E372|nr:RidA family protein [Hymenobacter sp. 15J16-1T3B]MCC3158478.1 RidA family protein [Hymenobacter sp. 15J16-1T3B]